MICYAKINLQYNLVELQQQVELLLKSKYWLAHYNKYHYEGSWNVLALKSINGDLSKPFAEPLGDNTFKNSRLLNYFPEVSKILDNLKCETKSVRLLNLKAGAKIKPHRDFDLCFEKGEVRLHFPVFTNSNVVFKLENEILPMQAGECWYINANLTHEVCNESETDRIHLVIDCDVNDWIKKEFKNALLKTKPDEIDIDLQNQIIYSLKLQNTVAAHSLADKMILQIKQNANK